MEFSLASEGACVVREPLMRWCMLPRGNAAESALRWEHNWCIATGLHGMHGLGLIWLLLYTRIVYKVS